MSLERYAPLITFATKYGHYLRKLYKQRGFGTLSIVRASTGGEPVILWSCHCAICSKLAIMIFSEFVLCRCIKSGVLEIGVHAPNARAGLSESNENFSVHAPNARAGLSESNRIGEIFTRDYFWNPMCTSVLSSTWIDNSDTSREQNAIMSDKHRYIQ